MKEGHNGNSRPALRREPTVTKKTFLIFCSLCFVCVFHELNDNSEFVQL